MSTNSSQTLKRGAGGDNNPSATKKAAVNMPMLLTAAKADAWNLHVPTKSVRNNSERYFRLKGFKPVATDAKVWNANNTSLQIEVDHNELTAAATLNTMVEDKLQSHHDAKTMGNEFWKETALGFSKSLYQERLSLRIDAKHVNAMFYEGDAPDMKQPGKKLSPNDIAKHLTTDYEVCVARMGITYYTLGSKSKVGNATTCGITIQALEIFIRRNAIGITNSGYTPATCALDFM